MSTNNTHGKIPYLCSCGIRVNLEPHEVPQWLGSHGSIFAGIKHEIKQIGTPIQPETIMGMLETFRTLGEQQQKDSRK